MKADREIIELFSNAIEPIRELPQADFYEAIRVMAFASMETLRVAYGEQYFKEFVGAIMELKPTADKPAAIIVRKEDLLQPKH